MRDGCLKSIWRRLDEAYDNPKTAAMTAFEQLFPQFPPGNPKTIDNLDAIDLAAKTFE